jgi:uncharacterized protein (DUF3084 family)
MDNMTQLKHAHIQHAAEQVARWAALAFWAETEQRLEFFQYRLEEEMQKLEKHFADYKGMQNED